MFTMLNNTPLNRLMMLGAAAGAGKAVEAEATGNPLVFTTDLARPLKSLLIPFTPQQEGSGDPSPSNIRSILPWNGVNVWHGGKNITEILKNAPSGTFAGFSFKHKLDFNVKPNTDYTLSSTSTGAMNVLYFNGANSGQVGVNKDNPRTQNSGESGILSVMLYDRENIADYENGTIKVQLEEGSTATTIDQYEGITYPVSFPSPVYGGTLDVVSGVLTVEWAFANLNSESAWGSYGTGDGFLVYVTKSDMQVGNRLPGYCDMFPSTFSQTGANIRFGADDNVIRVYNINILGITDLSEWKEFIGTSGINICYPLATPQEIQLTPAQITALIGDNTIWSDADGSMTAVYLKKG